MEDFNNNQEFKNNFEDNAEPNQNSNNEQPFTPYNPVNYTRVKEVKEYKPLSRGFKFFCIIMASVIVLSGTCLARTVRTAFLTVKKQTLI